MHWNRFRYWLGGRRPWGYFGRLSGPETGPDYLVYARRGFLSSHQLRWDKDEPWLICRQGSGGWVEIGSARTLKEAKRMAERDFIGREQHV